MKHFSFQIKFVLLIMLFLSINCGTETLEKIDGDLSILPWPATLIPKDGHFIIDQNTWIQSDTFNSPSFDPVKVFNEVFQRKSGYSIPFYQKGQASGKDSKHLILIINSNAIVNKEGYRLSIMPFGTIISASSPQGVFYAFQTMRQIMRLDATPNDDGNQKRWSIPSVDIVDEPHFPYRGMHLDVCRHFMPVDFVKKYIDLLAYFKMNRFHWHLTEDQGWRIEIKKYPKLQEVAAWRDETLIGHYSDQPVRYDGTRHGGYYTQEQIKEVVAYATDRGVMIIPEIEMPGHSRAALAAYPELASTPGPFKVATTWGVFEDVFCPTEETFTFLQNVLDEVVSLFPSPYIHIGGDECPKVRWKESEYCQQLMRKEGLKNENELQSYFIRRIEKYLNSKGRNIIGWDEILEGGIAPNATIMSWRGVEGGIEAAKAGHDVIMTPGTHCYFDHYQADPTYEPVAIGGLTTLEKVYSFNPIPESLNEKEAKHILGAQGNLWTEYIPGPDHAEYMAYPRAIALAEALWTPPSQKKFDGFVKRLHEHLDRLDGLDVHYANHLQDPLAEILSADTSIRVVFKTYLERQTIFFARDTSRKVWDTTMSLDTVVFDKPGPVFYKTENSNVKQFVYSPSKINKAKISSDPPPGNDYPGRQGVATLKDGLIGNKYFNGQDWCGWDGIQFTIDVEFAEKINFDSIVLGVLSSPGSWIHPPQEIEVKGSVGQETYQTITHWSGSSTGNGRQEILLKATGSEYTHLRFIFQPLQDIPDGLPGAGHAAWTFLDEISLY